MALQFIINRLKTLVVLVLGVFRRAMCCLGRRRRSSCDSIPLSTIGVIPNTVENRTELQQWEQWEENPVVVVAEKPIDPIQAKIQQYRQQFAKPPENQDEENQYNFFQDMTPKITAQKKIILRNNQNEDVTNMSRLAMSANPLPTNELGEWEDNLVGWEGETIEEFGDPTAVLREERRRERERKLLEQHQRKVERNFRPHPLGAKISS